MRHVLFLFATIMVCSSVCAQSENQDIIGFYIWRHAVLLQPADITGHATKEEPILSDAPQKFRTVSVVRDSVIIQILDYTGQAKKDTITGYLYKPGPQFYKFNFKGSSRDYAHLGKDSANGRVYGAYQRYFIVSKDQLINHAIKSERIGTSLSLGLISLPFKFRPQKGISDFAGAFNFGASVGVKLPHWSWHKFNYSILTGYSLSTVSLDYSTVNKNSSSLDSINTFNAFSFSVGFLVEYQRVQAGLFVGADWLGRQKQEKYDWKYQGKPWLSLAFGISIFSPQVESSKPSTSSQ